MTHDDGLFGDDGNTSRGPSLLSDIENTVSSIESSVEKIASSISGRAREPEKHSMMWPNTDTPRSDFDSFDLSSLSGTLAPGVTEFDFESGTVSLSDVRTEKLTNSLGDVSEDYIRSFAIVVDGPCLVYIPQQDVNHYINEASRLSLSNIKAKNVQVQAFDVVSATVFAGTHPDMTFDVERTGKQFRRMSWFDGAGDYITPMDDSWKANTIHFTTQEETVNDKVISSTRIPVSNLDSFSLNALNLDNTFDMEINIQGRNTLFDDMGGGRYEKWADFEGWSRRSPKVVGPQTQKAFTVDDFPFRLMRVTPRCAQEGEWLRYGQFTITGEM